MIGLIQKQLRTLPKKNRVHAWYMRQIQVERDEAKVWAREEDRATVPDKLVYPNGPFINFKSFLP